MFENWNSLGVFSGNEKITKLDGLLKHHQIDTLAGCETQCDWRQIDKLCHFEHLISQGQKKKCVTGYNVTERSVHAPQGGTAMATFGRLSALVVDSGVDHTGLGRWCWQLIGKGRTLTLVVVVYQPCDKNKDSNVLSCLG